MDRALNPRDDLLASHKTDPALWIDPVPESFISDKAEIVENSAYW